MPPVISLALQIQPVIFIITVAASSSSSAVCVFGWAFVVYSLIHFGNVALSSGPEIELELLKCGRTEAAATTITRHSLHSLLIIPLPQVLIGIAFHNTWEEEFPASHLTLPFDFLRLPYPSFSRWGGPGGTMPCPSGGPICIRSFYCSRSEDNVRPLSSHSTSICSLE